MLDNVHRVAVDRLACDNPIWDQVEKTSRNPLRNEHALSLTKYTAHQLSIVEVMKYRIPCIIGLSRSGQIIGQSQIALS